MSQCQTIRLLACACVAFLVFENAVLAQGVPAEEAKSVAGADPDRPRGSAGIAPFARIEEKEYLRLRAEHIARLRGMEPGKPFDPMARIRAIRARPSALPQRNPRASRVTEL